jgi:hypothetical protein
MTRSRTMIVLACAWRTAVKKCPVGGFGTVDARIPLSQSVAWGPTMETTPLLESRAVDAPALTRDETAGGNLRIEEGIPTRSDESRQMAVRNGGGLAIRIQIIEPDSERATSSPTRGKR